MALFANVARPTASNMPHFPRLLEPLKLRGGAVLRNRALMGSMHTQLEEGDGWGTPHPPPPDPEPHRSLAPSISATRTPPPPPPPDDAHCLHTCAPRSHRPLAREDRIKSHRQASLVPPPSLLPFPAAPTRARRPLAREDGRVLRRARVGRRRANGDGRHRAQYGGPRRALCRHDGLRLRRPPPPARHRRRPRGAARSENCDAGMLSILCTPMI